MSIRTAVLALALCALIDSAASAGGLTAMRFADGWYLYGSGDGAIASLRLPHGFVSRIEVGQRIALVQASDGTYLYGVAGNAIVGDRLPYGTISQVALGEDIAVIQAYGTTYLHGLTRTGFAAIPSPVGRPNQVRVSGRIVLLSGSRESCVVGMASGGVAQAAISGRPSSIQLGRDSAVLQFSAGGTWVVGLGADGFSQHHASLGHPSNVVVPAARDRQDTFDRVHGETVE